MRYCIRCVQPDTRPGIYFDDNGVCGACLFQESKETIDWQARQDELQQVAAWARKQARDFDCAIGVSGGKDTVFQAFYARDELGLYPLLVNCEPDGITELGRQNIENLKQSGFDTVTVRPNPVILRQLMRRDFFRYLNPGKVTEYCLWASAYIVADKFNIPLVIQGENANYTQGVRGNIALGGDCLDAIRKRTTAEDRYAIYTVDGTTERDLFFYGYDVDALREKGTRGVWLGYYLPQWSQRGNMKFAVERGMKVRTEVTGTYIKYFQLDSDLVTVNQFLKWVKFGFGQCTDHANYDIRDGHITREEGAALVETFDGDTSCEQVEALCQTIDIPKAQFYEKASMSWGNMFKAPYVLRDPIWEQYSGDIDVYAVMDRLE